MKNAVSMLFAAIAIGACSFPDVTYTEPAKDSGVTDATTDSSVVSSDGSTNACDQDGDTYRAEGGTCGGTDCDDTDARRNPGVTTFQTYPTTNGDWNCDAIVEKEFQINVSCSSKLDQTSCNATSGYTGDPECGTSGDFVQCMWNGLTLPPGCVSGTTTQPTQGCM